MRKAIRARLLDTVPTVEKRVYEPFIPGPKTPKPYLVVKRGGDIPTNIRQGFDVPFEVWVYCERTSFVGLDALQATVVSALNGVELQTTAGQAFSLRFAGASEDYYDEDWAALTRRLEFETVTVWGG